MKSQSLAWILALALPFLFAPCWVAITNQFDWMRHHLGSFTSASGGMLVLMLAVCSWTDLQSRRIPNWATYAGILWGLASNAWQSGWGTPESERWLGAIGITDSAIGLLVLFLGLMFIFGVSGGGAGDVKLVGAMGAFLGLKEGIEAVMLSFVFCALISLLLLACQRAGRAQSTTENREAASPSSDSPNEPPQKVLKTRIPLAPFFAFGTLLILLRQSGWFEFQLLQF